MKYVILTAELQNYPYDKDRTFSGVTAYVAKMLLTIRSHGGSTLAAAIRLVGRAVGFRNLTEGKEPRGSGYQKIFPFHNLLHLLCYLVS